MPRTFPSAIVTVISSFVRSLFEFQLVHSSAHFNSDYLTIYLFPRLTRKCTDFWCFIEWSRINLFLLYIIMTFSLTRDHNNMMALFGPIPLFNQSLTVFNWNNINSLVKPFLANANNYGSVPRHNIINIHSQSRIIKNNRPFYQCSFVYRTFGWMIAICVRRTNFHTKHTIA